MLNRKKLRGEVVKRQRRRSVQIVVNGKATRPGAVKKRVRPEHHSARSVGRVGPDLQQRAGVGRGAEEEAAESAVLVADPAVKIESAVPSFPWLVEIRR